MRVQITLKLHSQAELRWYVGSFRDHSGKRLRWKIKQNRGHLYASKILAEERFVESAKKWLHHRSNLDNLQAPYYQDFRWHATFTVLPFYTAEEVKGMRLSLYINSKIQSLIRAANIFIIIVQYKALCFCSNDLFMTFRKKSRIFWVK